MKNEFDTLREKWRNRLLGGSVINSNDPDIKTVVDKTSEEAGFLWVSMDKSKDRRFLWEEISSDKISGHITECYIRLRKMSLAYCMKGSSLENNKELLKDILGALDWLYENRYNENSNYYDNWWPWDIGVPLRLNDIVVLIYDSLSHEQITNYMRAVHRFVSDPTVCRSDKIKSTGANRVDLCKVVAISGVIIKNHSKLELVRDSLSEVFQYVTEEDGFYRDGSFVQHGAIPYTCSYGAVLIEGLSVMLQLLSGSPWEIIDPSVNNVYQWIYDSYEPLIYKGAAMDMVRGRAVSRYFLQDHVIGHEIISSILRLSTSASEPHGTNFKSMVKYWIKEDLSRSFYEDMDIESIISAKQLMEDEGISPKEELIGHWNFVNMDRVVHRGLGYAFALSMYSKRIQNYEDMNDENKRAWYTSEGMTYLYNNDLKHYSDDFWPTINAYRMAGTTVDTAERQVVLQKHGMGGQRKSTKSWVGGTSIAGLYGAAGMDLDSGFSSLIAKKSWFMFQEEIVALGAGISSIDGRNTETIVENRRLEGKGENHLNVDGNLMPSYLGWQKEVQGASWIHLQGSTKGADIGYYFPQKTKLKALREERKGSWRDINAEGPSDEIKRNYLTLWFDHGLNPRDESYNYVILPNKSREQVRCYAERPEIIILQNSKEVQAVKNIRLNIIAANIWGNRENTIEYITCNKKASLMVMEQKDLIEFSISDPTMENQGVIEVTIRKMIKDVLYKDEAIEFQKNGEEAKLIIDVKESKGKTFNIKFKV